MNFIFFSKLLIFSRFTSTLLADASFSTGMNLVDKRLKYLFKQVSIIHSTIEIEDIHVFRMLGSNIARALGYTIEIDH